MDRHRHRHSLLDDDATPTNERTNVFGDEFEVDYFDGVADGFRPNVDREGDAEARQDDIQEPAIRSISAHYATSPVSPLLSHGPMRDSIRKQRNIAANPFASPDDEQDDPQERPQSLEFERDEIARRSLSSASSHVYAGTNSPRFGAGPSHPYGAYQQGVARTLSVGTASTATTRPEPRQSYSQSRPQHPYALYPQGVDDDLDEDEDDDTVPMRMNPVPVGFPGLGQNYTRRLGPDGEDQDIIGEDGHTEQLPPYTRYPEDGPEKMPLLPPSLHSRAPVAGTDPTMPLMHTALGPSSTPQPPQSMMDDSPLERRRSRASTAHLVSSSASTLVAKSWNEKSWKEKRKTRVCGPVKCWWILLALGVLTFIGAVLGGVLGGFVAGGNHARNKAGTVTVVTSLYDASIIATPTSGAPPTGTYALTVGPPQEVQSQCLPTPAQQVAWDCDLSPNANLGITVYPPMNGNNSGANIFYASNDTSIAYGAQLSYMNTPFAQFLAVQDNDNKTNGPAFYFQSWYDKVVVVPESAIQAPPPSRMKAKRRGLGQGQSQSRPTGWIVPEQWRQRKQVATPGERPWFCVWNATSLEAFIYVHQPIVSPTSSSPASTTTTSNASTQSTTSGTTTGAAWPGITPPPAGPNIITTTIMAPLTTATYTGPASAFNPWASDQMRQAKDRLKDSQMGDNQYPKRGQAFNANDPWDQMQLFPFQVKLEERRLPNNPQNPYCQQYQILDSWSANWVADHNGNPIIVELTEQDPNFGAYQSAGVGSVSKRMVPGACHCQWMSGTVQSADQS